MAKNMTLLWCTFSAPCLPVMISPCWRVMIATCWSQGTPGGQVEQALMCQCMFEGRTFYEKLSKVVFYEYYVPERERHDSAIK
ncbi:unnamed protein product, partial [Coregonus sp. 'balchen']